MHLRVVYIYIQYKFTVWYACIRCVKKTVAFFLRILYCMYVYY